MSEIAVSIFMLTYNQEDYIEQSINSILSQKTSFKYQLVIGEDCSTDATRTICESYAKKFPNQVKLLSALPQNIGLIKNYLRTIAACDGKYIAICDGDDYWIDDFKLQKQVDFLENNSDFYIVGTNLKKLYNNGELRDKIKTNEVKEGTFDDLIFGNFLASVTVMFRNIQIKNPIPQWISQYPYGDWPTYLWTIKNEGKIHTLDDITAVYRSDVGVSASIRKKQSDIVKINLSIVENIASDENFKHKKEVVLSSLQKHKQQLIASYHREKKYSKALRYMMQALFSKGKKIELIRFYLYSIKQSI